MKKRVLRKKAKKSTKANKRSVPRKAAKAVRANKRALLRAGSKAKRKPLRRAPPKAKRAKRPAPAARVVRRDGTGHLQPKYAAELRELSAEDNPRDSARAFLERPRSADDLAEELGEEAVETMTSGEYDGADVANQSDTEEDGGPFVESSGRTEFARGTDASNPKNAKREPFPTT
jgi:hypothetical protein